MTEGNNIVKDISRLMVSKDRTYGITDSDNIQKSARKHFHDDMTWNAEYLYNALKAMKHLNEDSLRDIQLHIPKDPFPLLIDNGIQCYLVAPIADIRKG